jgi:uncharacterized protein (TIRG00374 family)
MKKLLLLVISFLIGIGLFIWIGQVIGWSKIKDAFLAFTGWQGLVILGLTLLIMLVGSWKWKEILKGEDVQISFRDVFRPYLAGFAIMFLAPILLLGGEIFRSYALKEKNSISWSKGMSSVIIDRILEWTTNLTVILLGLLFFLLMVGLPPKNLGIIFGSVFFLFAIAISYFYLKVFKKESIIKVIARWLRMRKLTEQNTFLNIEKEIYNFFKPRKKAMWKVFGLSFLRAAVMYLRAWFLIIFLGKEISFLPALSILGFTYLAAMIPIPTALGSHEAIQTFAFNSLALGAGTATAFTMIIRGAELIIALFGIIILFHFGIKIVNKFLFRKLEELPVNNNSNQNEV